MVDAMPHTDVHGKCYVRLRRSSCYRAVYVHVVSTSGNPGCWYFNYNTYRMTMSYEAAATYSSRYCRVKQAHPHAFPLSEHSAHASALTHLRSPCRSLNMVMPSCAMMIDVLVVDIRTRNSYVVVI